MNVMIADINGDKMTTIKVIEIKDIQKQLNKDIKGIKEKKKTTKVMMKSVRNTLKSGRR